MIRDNIEREYPAHIEKCRHTDRSLFIADYTEQTKWADIKRGVEFFEGDAPDDIKSLALSNSIGLPIHYIGFDKKSFKKPNGDPSSQCECVVFPKNSNNESWIFFAELKYGEYKNNDKNLRKAIKQLYKTRSYYYQSGIFSRTNTCYLFASLPMQAEPFVHSMVSQSDLLRLKRDENIILRLTNNAEIQNNKMINC